MSTQSIIEAAKAQTEEPEEEKPRSDRPWVDIDTLVHEPTGLAVVITKRVKGRTAYSFSIVRIEKKEQGEFHNRFIFHGHARQFYQDNPEMTAADIVRALVAEAEEKIRALAATDRPQRPRHNKQRRGKGGLSELSRQDAQRHGHEHEGKTARRRRKGKGKRPKN